MGGLCFVGVGLAVRFVAVPKGAQRKTIRQTRRLQTVVQDPPQPYVVGTL